MNDEIKKIYNELEKIEYGFRDENNDNILDVYPQKWENDFQNFYFLQTPDELLKSKCGVCWDQVELERKLFSDINMETKSYFIYIVDKDMLPSHTFITYECDDKYYWFEHSWGVYAGIHEYNKFSELLDDIESKFIESHPEVNKGSLLYIYEYKKPIDHIKCDDFYKYIETQKLVRIKEIN